jgi:Holliday junction resolvase RusA-like endonuclease
MSIWRAVQPYLAFVIYFRAQPKERHDNRGRTPVNTRVFEREIVDRACREEMQRAKVKMLPRQSRVGLRLKFYFVDHDPDLSNVVKAIEDGCNGSLYDDDSSVKYIESEVWPCATRVDERCEIEVLVL